MNVVFPQDMRVNADWLADDQYDALMAAPKTPLEDVVIHLELCMGLRNVEVCRLMLNNIHNTGTKPYINVRGKGRGDGKYRSIRLPLHDQGSPRQVDGRAPLHRGHCEGVQLTLARLWHPDHLVPLEEQAPGGGVRGTHRRP